jgi:hypothetical protein
MLNGMQTVCNMACKTVCKHGSSGCCNGDQNRLGAPYRHLLWSDLVVGEGRIRLRAVWDKACKMQEYGRLMTLPLTSAGHGVRAGTRSCFRLRCIS